MTIFLLPADIARSH